MGYVPTRPIYFTRLRNNDATIDSICNKCFLGVARGLEEADLKHAERRHVCQPEERRQVVRMVHGTPEAMRAGRRLARSDGGGSGLSQSAKMELIRANLFLHPCPKCEKSVDYLSANDDRVCFRCQLSMQHRWKELAPLLPKSGEVHRCHELQFYSSDESFLNRCAAFAGAALRAGDAVVVIATELHRNSLFHRLLAEDLDVPAASDQGRYLSLDAADMLSTFMVNDLPDPVRFWEVTTALIMAARKATTRKPPRVAVCGDCAPLLWVEGKTDAAIRLEGLWDEIAKTEGVDVLCGYPGGAVRPRTGERDPAKNPGKTLSGLCQIRKALEPMDQKIPDWSY